MKWRTGDTEKLIHIIGEGVGTSGNWETTQRTSKCTMMFKKKYKRN